MRMIIAAIAAATVSLFFSGATFAASLDPLGPYAELASCSAGDVSGGAVDCFGAITGGSTNAQSVDVNNATFVNLDGSSSTGLFGITNWYDIYGSATNNASFGSVIGSFNVNWDLTGSVAVMLKFGQTWSAYLYNGLSQGTYTYDLSGIGQNALSNFRIVSTNQIPVPAALPLLALGLVGLGIAGRRRKAS